MVSQLPSLMKVDWLLLDRYCHARNALSFKKQALDWRLGRSVIEAGTCPWRQTTRSSEWQDFPAPGAPQTTVALQAPFSRGKSLLALINLRWWNMSASRCFRLKTNPEAVWNSWQAIRRCMLHRQQELFVSIQLTQTCLSSIKCQIGKEV